MRAALCRAYGPPSAVEVAEFPEPVAGEGEVVVAVAAAAANFPDVLLVADQYQVHVPTPFTPGSELAGVVEEVGPGVQHVQKGDRVRASTLIGAFAERVVVRAGALEPVPPGVDLEVAAAFAVAHRTAYHALRSVARAQEGEWLVVLGAAGGVGLAAVELGAVLGLRVIAAASTSEKVELCLSRGAEAGIDYAKEDLKARIKEITGGGADVVVDPVGGPYAEQAIRAMGWGGRFVCVGFASGEIPRIPLNLVLLKGVHLTGFTMAGLGANQPEDMARDMRELDELVASGRVVPHISARYPLVQADRALADLAERRVTGKVLVIP